MYYHTKANVAMLKSVSHLLYIIVLAIHTKEQESRNQSYVWNGTGVNVAYSRPKTSQKVKNFQISIIINFH